ncbi:hypothetical protein F4808DRAFT_280541 [Astrocystis sublimbata]|nr:hypothetical protein F4808DRAFT_280541 [Astrocystis sublimbata]
MRSTTLAALHTLLSLATASSQPSTSYLPIIGVDRTTTSPTFGLPTTSEPHQMKTLSVCCCCLAGAMDEPQPTAGRYIGECSKAGTKDVCGSDYTGISGYAMEGLEGHPEDIEDVCSITRCGAMRYVD